MNIPVLASQTHASGAADGPTQLNGIETITGNGFHPLAPPLSNPTELSNASCRAQTCHDQGS
ncbi:unannotated protein [freshwater metagenome]|uniref:Unannotated protein n=1 Tax=freshwater metagenome TaxID=449393 RepID=A0A6J7ERY0_9ZZZZ